MDFLISLLIALVSISSDGSAVAQPTQVIKETTPIVQETVKTEVVKPVSVPTTQPTQATQPEMSLLMIESQMSRLKNSITAYKGFIELHPNDPDVETYKSDLKKFEEELKVWEARLATFNAQQP
ncbi:hypothetical protein [Gorillibacterium sp. sgz5001074]|uniref:hypothetical protein n=1 Tax=Gorillibacterium sp. sgz5001074 TaxID=3446695 RepID=UPI003F66E0AC